MKPLKILLYFLLLCFCHNVIYSLDLPFNSYYARVKKNDINVRARASTSSEIMYTLQKGEDVLVIGESGEWIKIKPKEGFSAWVHKDMIERGLIAKNNVNVRAGPSQSNSIIGKLSEGDAVIEIKNEGEWVQIEMPKDFGFWIAKFLVYFLCPENNYKEYLTTLSESLKAFAEAEEFRKKELTKRYTEVDHDAIINRYQVIIDKYPDTPEGLKAHERITDARSKQSMAKQKEITINDLRKLLSLFDEAEELKKRLELDPNPSLQDFDDVICKYKYITENYSATKEARMSLERLNQLDKLKKDKAPKWEEINALVYTGKVRPVSIKTSAYPKATHILTTGGFGKKTICALFSSKNDLRAFEKREVEIKGPIITEASETIKYPLIEVDTISLK